MKIINKAQYQNKKHAIIRKKISGTKERPRLCIKFTNTSIISQLINDDSMTTLAFTRVHGKNKEAVLKASADISLKAKKKKIASVVFDRSGYRYIGKTKLFADECRKKGLVF